MIAVVALCIVALAALGWAFLAAPLGYEDAAGFHYGPELFDHAPGRNADRLSWPGSVAPFHEV